MRRHLIEAARTTNLDLWLCSSLLDAVRRVVRRKSIAFFPCLSGMHGLEVLRSRHVVIYHIVLERLVERACRAFSICVWLQDIYLS